MGMAQPNKTSFEDRLARINQGGPNTMGEVHVGPVDEEVIYGDKTGKKAKKAKNSNVVRVKSKKKSKRRGTSVLLLPIAAFIGAVSMLAGDIGEFHMFTDGGLFPVENPVEALDPYVQYAEFAIAALLALIFIWAFQFRGLLGKVAVIGGAFAFVYYQPQLVDMYPDVFTAFFSEGYQPRNVTDQVNEQLRAVTDRAIAFTQETLGA